MIHNLGWRGYSAGFRVQGEEFRTQSLYLGLRVKGAGSRV